MPVTEAIFKNMSVKLEKGVAKDTGDKAAAAIKAKLLTKMNKPRLDKKLGSVLNVDSLRLRTGHHGKLNFKASVESSSKTGDSLLTTIKGWFTKKGDVKLRHKVKPFVLQ